MDYLPITESIFSSIYTYDFLTSICEMSVDGTEECFQTIPYTITLDISCHGWKKHMIKTGRSNATTTNYRKWLYNLDIILATPHRTGVIKIDEGQWVSLMPVATWIELNETILNSVPLRTRNCIMKVYCYLYYNFTKRYNYLSTMCFGHSIENIAAELSMDASDVGRIINELVKKGFLMASKYSFTLGFARTYMIPKKHLHEHYSTIGTRKF